MGDIVERITRKNQDLESELPLTISAQYGLIDQNEFFDKRIASKDVSGYYLVKNGEFAYNKSTSSDAPWGAVKRLDRYDMGVLSTLYIVFSILDESKTNSDFLVTYYDTNLWHKGVQAIAAEGARNHGLLNITPSDFFETTLSLPQDIEEQKRIGELFRNLDNLITHHQRKCGKIIVSLQSIALVWEQRKLGEVAQITMGQSPNGSTYSDTPSDYILVQGNADLKDGWVTPRIWTTQKTKTASAGDLIMSVRAPAGAMGKTGYDVVLGRGVAGIKGNEFIYQTLVKLDDNGYWKKLAAGSTFESVNSDAVNNAVISVPRDIDEQEKIGDYFKQIDSLITHHQREWKGRIYG